MYHNYSSPNVPLYIIIVFIICISFIISLSHSKDNRSFVTRVRSHPLILALNLIHSRVRRVEYNNRIEPQDNTHVQIICSFIIGIFLSGNSIKS